LRNPGKDGAGGTLASHQEWQLLAGKLDDRRGACFADGRRRTGSEATGAGTSPQDPLPAK